MTETTNLDLTEILTGHGVKHRIAEILWGGGMTATEALWQADQVVSGLRLREERDWDAVQRFGEPSPYRIVNRHRWVTEWEADDE